MDGASPICRTTCMRRLTRSARGRSSWRCTRRRSDNRLTRKRDGWVYTQPSRHSMPYLRRKDYSHAQPKVRRVLASSDDRATSVQEPNQKQHERDDQQHVHGCADRIGADEAQQPGHQQNYREDEQHHDLPASHTSRERAVTRNGRAFHRPRRGELTAQPLLTCPCDAVRQVLTVLLFTTVLGSQA